MFESRERMTRIVEQGDDFIWSVDPLNFGLLSFNERYCDYFEQQRGIKIKLGDRPEELFTDPEFVSLWRGMFNLALAEAQYQTEYRVFAGNRILDLAFQLVEQGGRPIAISVFGKDLTGLKATEVALKDSEDRYRSLFEKSHAVMLVINPMDGAIVSANLAAERFYGGRMGRPGTWRSSAAPCPWTGSRASTPSSTTSRPGAGPQRSATSSRPSSTTCSAWKALAAWRAASPTT